MSEPLQSPISVETVEDGSGPTSASTHVADSMGRRAKIVCTIGPASSSEVVLRDLLRAGMDVARLNFSHGTYNIIYGPLGAAIALLVWLYIISLIVLIGAEFNALIYPRTVLTAPSPSGGEPFTSGI